MRRCGIAQSQHALVTDGGTDPRMLSYANTLGHLPEIAGPGVLRDEVDLSGESRQRLEVPQTPQPGAAVPHAVDTAPTAERSAGWRHDHDSRP
eukprot:971208-Heterocapsa_arctica.AAC.1